MADVVKCNSCGIVLDESPRVSHNERNPCPQCGSTNRKFSVHAELAVEAYISIGLFHKRPGIKRPLAEIFDGWELRKSSGELVRKCRLIDRESDRYRERIATRDGRIIREIDERLSAHRGHGSAKFREPEE